MRKNLFDKVAASSNLDSIYQDTVEVDGRKYAGREILGPEYTPSNILYRSKQIRQLIDILGTSLRGQPPSSILAFGKTGTGKTVATKGVLNDLVEKVEAEQSKIPIHCRYINCTTKDTSYSILSTLANSFTKDSDGKFSLHPGKSINTVYEALMQRMNGINIIVLDEIEKLIFKDGSNVLYNLMEINSNTNGARVNIIGISNNFKYEEKIDPKTRGRLNAIKLVFPPYDANELNKILRDRIKLAFHPKTVADSAINLTAAVAASYGGDARYAIGLLKQAADIATQADAKKLTDKHVEKAKGPLEKDILLSGVQSLSEPTRFILGIITSVTSLRPRKPFWTTGEIYKIYQAACQYLEKQALTSRRVTDLITLLNESGVIEASAVSFGKAKGRSRKIKPSHDLSLTEILYDGAKDAAQKLEDSVKYYLTVEDRANSRQ